MTENKVTKMFKTLKSKLKIKKINLKSNPFKKLIKSKSKISENESNDNEMSQNIIQIKDYENLKMLEDTKTDYTICSIDYEHMPNDDILKELYLLKMKNRTLFLLLEITNSNYSIKDVIKTAIEYGCDGFFINGNTESEILNLTNVLSKLPQPYDFNWKIYYTKIKNNLDTLTLLNVDNINTDNLLNEHNHLNYPTSVFVNRFVSSVSNVSKVSKALKNKSGKLKIIVDLKLKK